MYQPRDFPRVKNSDTIRWKGSIVNMLFDAIRFRDVPPGPNFHRDRDGSTGRRRSTSADQLSWVRCKSDDNIAEYSIVEVYDADADSDGLILYVRRVTTAATVFAANENYPLWMTSGTGTGTAQAQGWVKLVNPYEPVLINASEAVAFLDNLDVNGDSVKPGSLPILAVSTRDADNRCYVLGQTAATARRFKITDSSVDSAYRTGTGTGTGTGSNADLGRIAVYRTAYPLGFGALPVNEVDSIIGSEERIYADYIRSVFVTNDIVWCERLNGKWQIRDEGRTLWIATALEDIANGYYGSVLIADSLDGGVAVRARILDDQDSISAGTSCLVMWVDGSQQFIILPVTCPAPVV